MVVGLGYDHKLFIEFKRYARKPSTVDSLCSTTLHRYKCIHCTRRTAHRHLHCPIAFCQVLSDWALRQERVNPVPFTSQNIYRSQFAGEEYWGQINTSQENGRFRARVDPIIKHSPLWFSWAFHMQNLPLFITCWKSKYKENDRNGTGGQYNAVSALSNYNKWKPH